MQKFNQLESNLLIDALNSYISQVEKDILKMEEAGKPSIFAPGFYTMISKELQQKVKAMTAVKPLTWDQ